MEKNSDRFMLSILNGRGALMERQAADKILACNTETSKYGLALTKEQAYALAVTRTNSLKETRRIELNGSMVDKLILAFCDSPYMEKERYEETLHELIHMFYDLKNNTWDIVSDDELVDFMKTAFNGQCFGTLELLSGEILSLVNHIHGGGTMKNFKNRNGEQYADA